MIFRATWQSVLNRTKTQSRRPVRPGFVLRERKGTKSIYSRTSRRAVYSVGRDYAVQAERDRTVGRIRITDIRLERLQDISGEDVVAEGYPQEDDGSLPFLPFIGTWQSFYRGGRYDWGRNPRVFVVEFELIMSHDHV